MGAWSNKPCQGCGRKKGPKQRNLKFCYSCRQSKNKERSRNQHSKMLQERYGITLDQYESLYELQGGVCYLCRHATGKRRRLTVDHDHGCCADLPACGRCVRGLLCQNCNRNVLGWAARDSLDFFYRGIEYLTSPPFLAILKAAEAESGSQNGSRRGRSEGKRGNKCS